MVPIDIDDIDKLVICVTNAIFSILLTKLFI